MFQPRPAKSSSAVSSRTDAKTTAAGSSRVVPPVRLPHEDGLLASAACLLREAWFIESVVPISSGPYSTSICLPLSHACYSFSHIFAQLTRLPVGTSARVSTGSDVLVATFSVFRLPGSSHTCVDAS
jgi:hypothetical protein